MSRDKYIIVFHDITQANPDWGSLYKAYLPAESLLSAALLAKSVKGMVVGMIDDEGELVVTEDIEQYMSERNMTSENVVFVKGNK